MVLEISTAKITENIQKKESHFLCGEAPILFIYLIFITFCYIGIPDL